MRLKKKRSNPSEKEFWRGIEEASAMMDSWPEWKKKKGLLSLGGIVCRPDMKDTEPVSGPHRETTEQDRDKASQS